MLTHSSGARAQAATLAGQRPRASTIGAAPALLAQKNALGIPVGSFTLLPSLKLSSSYDDNVFLRQDDTAKDVLFTAQPTVNLQSNWSDNALSLGAYLIDTRYAKYTQNNSDQYQFSGDGSLTVNRSWTVKGSASYGHLIEPRGTPGDDFTAGRFAFYDATNLSGDLLFRLNRVLFTGGISTNRRTYDDRRVGSVTMDQSYRNHHIDTLSLRVDYQLDATTSLFASGSPDRYVYSSRNPLLDRSSKGFSALAGVNTELTRLIKGELGIGYLEQNFKSPGFASFHGFNYSADINYTPTALTTVHFSADRSLQNSGLPQVPGVLTSEFRLTVEHELTRKINLQTFVEHDNDRYRGITRTDNRLYLGASANFAVHRSITLSPFYKYLSRTVNGGTGVGSVHDNRFGVSLTLAP